RTALQVLQRKVSRQQESRVQAKDSALPANPGVHLKATPANDDCTDATPIGNGTFTGDTSMATPDGSAGCGFSDSSPDVWFRYSTPIDSNVFVDTIGSEFDTVLAVFEGCPGSIPNEIACNDNSVGLQSALQFFAFAGTEYLVRVAGFSGAAGPYTLNVGLGGSITGRVTDALTGEPLPFLTVSAERPGRFDGRSGATNLDGTYSIDGLGIGTYVVYIENASDYLPEIYDNLPCPGSSCDLSLGTRVTVEQGVVVEDIDFTLDLGGSITGTVTDAGTGEPLASATVVTLTDGGDTLLDFLSTNSEGRYTASGLPAGSYLAHTLVQDYQDELWDNVPCPGGVLGGCEGDAGTEIPVVLRETTEGVDFALERLGSLAGTITASADGSPLEFAGVEVWNADGNPVGSGVTDSSGAYRVGGLPAGNYRVSTSFVFGFRDELFDDRPCPNGVFVGCDPTTGDEVTVQLDRDTPGIDFALDRLGAISGNVIDADTQQPIPFVTVSAFDTNGNFIAGDITNVDGDYRVALIPAGDVFATATMDTYFGEVYDDKPCPLEGCDPTTGTPISVSLEATTEGIDFALKPLGAIAGTVTDSQTDQPLPDIVVRAISQDGVFANSATTDAEGRFVIERLGPGDYRVTTSSPEHLDERYDDIPCPESSCGEVGILVPVNLSATTEGIDFALDRLGSISGQITLAGGGDHFFSSVSVRDLNGNFIQGVSGGSVDASGSYTYPGLPAGTYLILASNLSDFVSELYDDIPCQANCDFTAGTPVVVELGQDTGGIDFVLERSGSISGEVVDSATGEPLDVFVQLFNAAGSVLATNNTFGSGSYSFDSLATGTYFVGIGRDSGYFRELYDNVPCAETGCDPTTGTPIFITPGLERDDIDFALDSLPVGAIAGRLTDALTGQPVRTVNVQLWNAAGDFLAGFGVDDQGRYRFERLEPGTYTVSTATFSDYNDELWDDLPCPGGAPEGCDPTTGTPIVVTAGTVTSNIDFTLVPSFANCVPSATELCLAGGRFRVEATWQNQVMATGDGRSVGLTGDTGYFWFFDPDNVELVVKVLDACLDFDRFWVFAGGLTDVGVVLTVTDTLTGARRVYDNTVGTPFAPVLDTDAFTTCSDGAAAGRDELRLPVPFTPLDEILQQELGHVPPKNLSLNDGRFNVRAVWATDGASETAEAVVLTDDTGYFWFFDADNVEVVVKVLDACGLLGFDNFWVFAAGLTDVEVTLTVTDTLSGQVQVYQNPLGSPFQPIQDTAAFDTCDAMPRSPTR
ncbi:MAG: carboxypeptidase regulatory-like domain-containing protein, partial [Acidobacteriota bacterium]